MNKRYIDFVPSKSNTAKRTTRGSTVHVVMPNSKSQQSKRTVSHTPKSSHATTPKRTVNSRPNPTRPTNRANSPSRPTPKVAVKRPINAHPNRPTASHPTAHVATTNRRPSAQSAPALGVIEDLNPTFVNTNVPKRPLNQTDAAKLPPSRRIQRKPTRTPSPTASPTPHQSPKSKSSNAPVTIITKPTKDSRAGLIVTIIITIILGATAGTVAFLLLPK